MDARERRVWDEMEGRDAFRPIFPPHGVPPRPWSLAVQRDCLCTTDYILCSPQDTAKDYPFRMHLGHFRNAPAAAQFTLHTVNAFDALVAVAWAAATVKDNLVLARAVRALDEAHPGWREWPEAQP